MTLQQMEYIVAVDKYCHFGRAAEACHVTQSTLSILVQKLEVELDVIIFDRNVHPVKPTMLGNKIIEQAKILLYNASQMKEIVKSEREQETGEIKLGIISTVAPYIIPKLFKYVHEKFPGIILRITEARTESIIKNLELAELDMAILATPLHNNMLLEVPVYYEKFVAYVSPLEEIYKQKEIDTHKLPFEHLWVLQEGNCLRNQVLNICEHKSGYSAIYEAGSIDTLVKIVDENGGYTIIPELHVDLLRKCQRLKIRKIVNPSPVREISIVVRHDYVHERMLNIIASCVREIIPEHMIDKRLKKFAIRL